MKKFINEIIADKESLKVYIPPIASFLFLLIAYVIEISIVGGQFGTLFYTTFFAEWPLIYMSFSLLITTFLFTYDEQPTPSRSVLIGILCILLSIVFVVFIATGDEYPYILVFLLSTLSYALSFWLYKYMAFKSNDYLKRKQNELRNSDKSAGGKYEGVQV